jgi:hypothetical protein
MPGSLQRMISPQFHGQFQILAYDKMPENPSEIVERQNRQASSAFQAKPMWKRKSNPTHNPEQNQAATPTTSGNPA